MQCETPGELISQWLTFATRVELPRLQLIRWRQTGNCDHRRLSTETTVRPSRLQSGSLGEVGGWGVPLHVALCQQQQTK